jgi:autotransporter-associated beta strand protein
MSPFYRRSAFLLTTTLAFLIAAGSAHAQVTYTWQNANGTWTNTTGAWSPTAGPQLSATTNNTDTALFSNVGSGNNTVSLTSNRTVYGAVFSSTANAYTFTASNRALDIMSGGGLVNNSTQTQTFNLPVQNASGNGQWSSVAGGSLLFNSGVNLTQSGNAQSRTLTLAGAGTITVNSTIANGGTATAGAITVTSNGSTILSGNNTYDGVTTMNATGGTLTLSGNNSGAAGGVTLTAGALNINHANALGTGSLTISAGVTIANTSGAAITNLGNNAITFNDFTFGTANSTSSSNLDLGTGNVTMSSSRTITLAGTNTTLSMGFGNITSSSSARTLTANGAGNTLVMRGLSLSQNATTAVSVKLEGSANIIIDGAIVPGTAFAHGITIQNNTGTTTFNGTNTYTGATTVSSGATLQIGNGSTSGSLAVASAIINNANLVFNRSDTLTQGTDFNGTISGTGRVIQAGSGTLVLNGTNTYTGATTINAGTLSIASITNGGVAGVLGNSTNAAGNLVLGGGTLLYTAASGSTDRNFTLTNGTSSTINVTTALSISGTSATTNGSLTKTGAGTLTLSGANTFTGGLAINSGTLTGTVAGAMGTASNTVSFGGAGAGVLNLQATATTYTALLNASSANGTILINPAASGAGITHTIGATTLGGGYQLTVQGGSNVASGTAQLTTGAITLNGDGSIRVLDPAAGSSKFNTASNISGTGNLTLKNDGATAGGITISGTANHTGTITNSGSGTGDVGLSAIGTNVTGITQNSSTSMLKFNSGSNLFNGTLTINTGTIYTESTGGFGPAGNTVSFNGGGSGQNGTIIIARTSGSNAGMSFSTLNVTGGNGTIINELRAAGAAVTDTLNSVNLGGGYQLSVLGGGNVTSGVALVTTGAITLNGNATIAVLDNLSGLGAAAFNTASGITGTGNLTLKNNSSNSSSYITLGTASVNQTGSITNSGSGSGTVTISSVIGTNVTGVTQNSATSALTLSNVNTYTGATTISAGTLTMSSAGQLGSGTYAGNIANDGVFIYASSASQTLNGILSGAGALTKNGSSTLTLGGANTYSGGTTLNVGALNINNANALGTGALTITGGTIDNTSGSSITLASNNLQNWNGNFAYNGTSDLNLGTGAVTMSASRTVTVNAGNLTVGGAIGESGAGGYSLTKNGNGSLFLLNANSTYGNILTINGGIVNVGSLNNKNLPGPLGTSAGTQSKLVFNGGTLQYTGDSATSTDRNFRLTGNATFDASGNGSSATMGFNDNSFTPAVDAGNKTFTLTGSNTGNNVMNAILTDNAANNITSFVKNGVGTWVLGSTSSSYTGTTTINAGTLSIASIGNGGIASSIGASSNASANLVLGGGTLLYTGATTSTDRNFTLTDGTTSQINISNSNSNLTISGASASTTGGLTKAGAGTLVLSGNNTYTGATTINAGTLSIASITNGGLASALGSSTNNAANLVLGGGTLVFTGASGSTDRNFTLTNSTSSTINVTTALTISGSAATTSGNLTKAGAGTLTLSGNNTYTGTTTASAGVLKLDSANALPGGVGNTGGVSNLTFAGGVIGLTSASGDFTRGLGNGSTQLNWSGSASGGFAAYGVNRTVNIGGAGAAILMGSNGNFSGSMILGAADSDATVTLANIVTIRNNDRTIIVNDGSADVDAIISGAITVHTDLVGRSLSKNGAGTLALTGESTFFSANSSSILTINAGKVQIGMGGAAGSLAGSGTITNNGTLAFNRSDAISFTNTINGTGNVIQVGTGTTTLGAANNYSGTTSINFGALRAANATSLGSTAAGTTVSSVAALELSGGISIGAEALSLAGTGISSGGALRSVSGVNAYAGEITLASASRINTDVGSLTLSGNTTGSNTNLALGGEGDTVVTGGLSLGSGTLTKDGGGTVTLNGPISYSGATALNAGKLVINGSNTNSAITIASGATLGGAGTVGAVTVNSGGFIAPGNSPGTLTVGDLTLNGGGGYTWELANATGTAGTGWDLINVSGSTTINANSGNKFTVYISGTPTNWSSATSNNWNIMSWSTVTGFSADAFAVNTASFGVPAAGNWAFSNTGGYLNLAYTAATTADWNGGSGNWSTGFGATPTDGYGVTYYGAGGTSTNNIAAASLSSLASITFNGSAGAYTLNANSGSSGYDASSRLTVTGGIANDSTADQTINLALDLTGAVSATSGNITLGGSIANNSGITLVGDKNIALNETISGSGSIGKTGNGTATLAGANTYTGTTTLNGGVIRVTNSSGLGSTAAGTEVASGAALELSGGISIGAEALELNGTGISNGGALRSISGTNSFAGNIALGSATRINSDADSLTLSGNISGAYALTKGGAGTLILSGNNTYSGATTISAGTLEIAGIASQTLSGIISGAGALTKSGSGTLTLSAANTLTGGLAINSGTLTGTVAGAMGTASNTVTFGGSGGGVLNLQAAATPYTALLNVASANGTILINPATSGAGVTHTIGATTLGGGYQLTVQGGSNVASGTAQLTTGAITLTGNGIIRVLDPAAGSSKFNAASGITGTGNLTLRNDGATSGGITLATTTVNHTGAIINSGTGTGDVLISSVIGTNVTGITQNSSTSMLRLTGSNLFTSGVTINTGTVFVSAAASLGSSASTLYFAGGASSNGTLIISRSLTSPVSVNAKLDVTGGNGTIISENNSAGAGQIYSLATPTLGGGYQLSVRGGGNVTSGTSVFETTGAAITLSGNATIAVLDNLSGQAASAFNSSSGITGTGDLTLKNNSSNSSSYITLGTAAVNHTGSITNSGSGTGSVTISSVIGTNVTGVTQNSDTSALTLSNVNTYTGATTISAGTLTINGTGRLGSGTYAGNIVNDGTFAYASTASQTLSGIMSGAGALTKNGSSRLTLTGANTYTGGTTLSAGTLQIGSNSTTGSIVGNISNNGSLIFNRSDSIAFSGNISGSGSLTKEAAGTLSLSGTNTYTGRTVLTSGTIELANVAALSSNSILETGGSSSGGFTLKLGAVGNYAMDSLDLKGIIIVNGPDSGNANLTFTNGGVTTSTSSSRKIQAGPNANITFNGAMFDIASYSSAASRNLVLEGDGSMVFNAVLSDNSSTKSGGISKTGNGTVTFNAANTYTGATAIDVGTLVVTNSSALGGTANGTTVASGASLQLAGGITIGAEALSLSGNGTANNGALRNNSGDNTYNGNITLAAASRISSEAGSLTVGGNVTLASNTLTVATSAGNATFSGRISGTGSLVKDGAGTQVLSGNNTYTGTTTVNSGTLQASSANALGATSQVVMNNGGSFLVSASDSVSDNAAINLNGGTLAIGGGVGEVVGALTLSANSTIDMNGVGNSWITFASLTSVLDDSRRLEVWNYTPGSDAIYFQDQTNLASSLNYISFYSGAGTGTFYNALNTSSFSAPELYATVVPEPSTYIAAALLLGGLGVQIFRARKNLGKRS